MVARIGVDLLNVNLSQTLQSTLGHCKYGF